MATTQEKWQEIANRGLQDKFDAQTRPKFDEAVRRGLIKVAAPKQTGVTQIETLKEPGFSLAETVKNIPSSAVQFGKDIIQPIAHPIDTAKSMQSLGQGLVEKVLPKPDLPAGYEWDDTDNEKTANAVGSFFKDMYGSPESFLSTIQKDPVGVASDVAGLITGGGSLVPKLGGKIAKIGAALDPVNVALNSAQHIGKLIPKELPEKLLETAMKFRPSVAPEKRLSMTKTALEQGILPTVKGLEKITQKLTALDSGLNSIIDNATNRGMTIPKKVLFGEIRKLRKELGGAKLDAGKDMSAISSVAKSFDEQLKKLKKDKLTPREVQDLKRDAYKRINFDLSQGKGNFAKNETRKTIAKSAKESLEKIDPEIKEKNRQMGDLLELEDELEGVVGRLDNRNLISLDTGMKIAAGATVDPTLGTAIGAGASILGNPRIKARTAMILNNLRKNAEYADYLNNNLPPVLARQLLIQSGRIDQSLKKQLEKK